MMGGLFSSFRAVFRPESNRDRTFFHKPKFFNYRRTSHYNPPKPPTRAVYAATDGPEGVLIVRSIDVKIMENSREHHTDRFDLVWGEKKNHSLIVRRGQEFYIKLSFNRYYDQKKDAISFIFTYTGAERPTHGQKSLVAIPLLPKGHYGNSTWSAELESFFENTVTIMITTAPDCLVGAWTIDVDTKLKSGTAINFNYKTPIYILFNPWCIEDQVYIEGENQRTEYVLTDSGFIWRGTSTRPRPSVWKYGQFEKDILECALYLVSKVGKVGAGNMGDPVKIARALSACANSQDDYGVIMGNWTTDFGGGTPPSKWLGSMKILQQYWKTKKPVKYGQCWVFAGVITTIARALGIPCRVITNYLSAHDTQGSFTVDYFVDDDGRIMEELNSDSIWSYHCWNELWMKRSDLSEAGEYDGWQVVDATPLEASDGLFRCGPTSVRAVKRGEVQKPYDTSFVYSEVNADKLFWKYTGPTQPLKLLRKDIEGIGVKLYTKAVGRWVVEEVTKNYKYQEKTEEERDIMLKALKQSESLFSRYYLNEEFNDIYFDFILRDDIVIGSPFTVALLIQNKNAKKKYNVSVILRVDVINYMGKVGGSVKKANFDVTMEPESTKEVKVNVSYFEYYERLIDQCAFNISCLAKVLDTDFEYYAEDDFRVKKPEIKIKLESEAIEGQEVTIQASMVNPLPIPLRKGEFRFEGPGIPKQIKIKAPKSIYPSEELKVLFNIVPPFEGRHTIVAKFLSVELDDADGFLNFMVEPLKEVTSTGTV